jgi:RNA polymerase primary sigma factor
MKIKKVIFTDRNNSVLTSYLKEVARYKILPQSEIVDLIDKAQKGDIEARDKVIKSNIRFVITIAKQYQNRGIPLLDLISSGNEGLIKAVSMFKSNRGTPFLSYAVFWIKQCILNSIYWQGSEIRLPLSQQIIVNACREESTKFMQKHNREPSSEELSELTGYGIAQIDYLMQFINMKVSSVDDFIDSEESYQVGDTIPDDEVLPDEEINKEYMSKELDKILAKLPIREEDIIRMTFGIGLPKVAPKQICEMFGVTSERIRQMKESGLKKLRTKYKSKIKDIL